MRGSVETKGVSERHHHRDIRGASDASEGDVVRAVKDPVCGMGIDPRASAPRYEYNKRAYSFCSPGCLNKFSTDPRKYLAAAPEQILPVASGTIYTCPMHSQIRQVGPGFCPICGMALEPLP